MKNLLIYDKPATGWENGTPIGNGRIGAMVLGGGTEETLYLNEDTLWSGKPGDYTDPDAFEWLSKARTSILNKEYKDAEEIINKHMTGFWTESYLPMAQLKLNFVGLEGNPSEYKRCMDLNQALISTCFTSGALSCERKVFCSYPDQVIAIKCSFNKPVKIEANLTSQLNNEMFCSDTIVGIDGWCPEQVSPDYYECDNPIVYGSSEKQNTIHFRVGMMVSETDGRVNNNRSEIVIEACTYCVLLISSANSFERYNVLPHREYKHRLSKCLENAANKSFDELLYRHCIDYKKLFDRAEIDLGHTDLETKPMPVRLWNYANGYEDPELVATTFQFGRYLTIAASREGSQPTNLQGIWNDKLRAPWSSNYTININTEMNYWPTEVTNLSECAEPMLRFIEECAESGKKTASVNYHCRGWCVHHNVDLWRKTTAVGSFRKEINVQPWSFWLAGGGWLCRHLWEHYLYTCDDLFLRKQAFPVMISAARFYLDWMIEIDGKLITCPSTSPENMFKDNGYITGLSASVSMDNQVIVELFKNCVTASENSAICNELNAEDKKIICEIKKAITKIPLLQIGKYGQLQEWKEDYQENEVTHRHLSPLYMMYPSNLLMSIDCKYIDASRVALIRRGADGVAWSRAWKIAILARLHNGDEAEREIQKYLQPADDEESKEVSYVNGGIYENLFSARPLQIDGCFGFTAGVSEMLLQDYDGAISVLPAKPKSWKKGYIKGLRLRNGGQINIYWDGEKNSYEIKD